MVEVVGEPTAVLTLQKPEMTVSNSASSCYDEAIRKTPTYPSGQVITVRNPGSLCLCSVYPEKLRTSRALLLR
jgi:hypothetical protein